MKVYLSGSISKRDFQEATNHFNAVANHYVCRFASVFNPIRLGPPEGDQTWEDNMRICIQELMKCDTICMLQGWQESVGANLEREIALRLNIPVVYEGVDFDIGGIEE